MADFSFLLNAVCLVGQAVMYIFFIGCLTRKRRRLWHFAAYTALLFLIELLASWFTPNGGDLLPVGAGVLGLYLMSRFAMGNRRAVSWLAAVLAFYVAQLSSGIVASVEAAVFPPLIGDPLLYVMLFLAIAAFFLLCAGCYAAVVKLLPGLEDDLPSVELLLFPVLFCFAAELYVLHNEYSFFAPVFSLAEVGKQTALLILQAAGLLALFCTLYAYRHLHQGAQAQEELRSLAQAIQAQKVYIAEAQTRYEQTRAFRHDIKNHLSVLDGLLGSGKPEEGRTYLKKLETVSEALSFPWQTGNPVVDILLGEKLGLVKEIAVEVSLILPEAWGMDDLDLCVIFANALDNAILACRAAGGDPFIHIVGKRQGDLYMLTFQNSCPDGPLPPEGIGLSNIRAVAEKYHGAVLTEKTGRLFTLNVLLNIS